MSFRIFALFGLMDNRWLASNAQVTDLIPYKVIGENTAVADDDSALAQIVINVGHSPFPVSLVLLSSPRPMTGF
jgi:hypothetical protein